MMLACGGIPTCLMTWNCMPTLLVAKSCVYGDPAYPLRAHLQAPFRAGARALTPAMELYNKNMSKVRT